MDESIKRLEEKVAYLERHVTEQDKAMLALGDDVARLRLQLRKLREQLSSAAETGEESKVSERPPHY
jgi:SlyX protein